MNEPSIDMDPLARACALWQSGQNEGSSPLRGAARVLTGVRHYFEADFITQYERDARVDPEKLAAAQVLLDALCASELRDAAAWGRLLKVESGWVGRGTRGGPHADQIRASLATGRLEMPLWGVSLSSNVADSFGDRFTFEIIHAFPAIPATLHSGIKAEEQELIAGGVYDVVHIDERSDGGVLARLKYRATLRSLR